MLLQKLQSHLLGEGEEGNRPSEESHGEGETQVADGNSIQRRVEK